MQISGVTGDVTDIGLAWSVATRTRRAFGLILAEYEVTHCGGDDHYPADCPEPNSLLEVL